MSAMHMMTMVATLALLTVLIVLAFKKKSEDYQMKKLPPGYSPNVWLIHPVTGKIVSRTTTRGQTGK